MLTPLALMVERKRKHVKILANNMKLHLIICISAAIYAA